MASFCCFCFGFYRQLYLPGAGDGGPSERENGGGSEKERWEGRSNVMREDGELRDERERERRDEVIGEEGIVVTGCPFFSVLVINALGGKREAVDQMGGVDSVS